MIDPEKAVLIPLRAKYLARKGGGGFKSKTSNSGKADKTKVKGLKPRKKAYGPF